MEDPLIEQLRQGNFDACAVGASSQRRLLSRLTGLSYHADISVADGAVQAFGCVAACIAKTDPEYVRIHLRRLFWLLNDESGGIGWRAAEMVGEVIAACPGMFDEFISPLAFLLDMETEDAPRFQPGILQALTRIAQGRPEKIAFACPMLQPLLTAGSPTVRDLTAELLNQLPQES